mmetsp:Transcript_14088/g.23010  ORF Transcript_14088/g.23010 Transcript_14088/m.23010 type:complete len:526 (+) Transcript_14088:484-2061(+)
METCCIGYNDAMNFSMVQPIGFSEKKEVREAAQLSVSLAKKFRSREGFHKKKGKAKILPKLPRHVWVRINDFVGPIVVEGEDMTQWTTVQIPCMNVRFLGKAWRVSSIKYEHLIFFSSLQQLNLSHSGLRGEATFFLKMLSMALKAKSCCLKDLNLSNNSLGELGGERLGEALAANSSLQKLDLSLTDLGPEGGAAILRNIPSNLEELILSRNCLGEGCGEAIGDCIQNSNSLRRLVLVGNCLEGKSIAKALRVNTSLRVLDLEYNNLSPDCYSALGDALQVNTSLLDLNLKFNLVGSEGGLAIARGLAVNKALNTLNMEQNNLGPGVGSELGKALARNSTLTTLLLGGNSFGQGGAVALIQVLKSNHTLKALGLERNHLGPQDGIAVGEILRTNAILDTLALSGNCLKPEGGLALVKGLSSNVSLKKLTLASNKLDAGCGILLSEALLTNSTLQYLDVSNNTIGREGGKAIRAGLIHNSSLKKLKVAGNFMGPDTERSIFETVENKDFILVPEQGDQAAFLKIF